MDKQRTPPYPSDQSTSRRKEFKKLKEEHETLQVQHDKLQKELEEKVTTLDYYWRKSKELECKSNAFEVLLDLKNKELAQVRQELDKKSEETPKEETTALKNQLEDLFQKEWDLQVKCLQNEKTIEDLTSDVATLTSASKEKDEVISKLEKESSEAQESLRNQSEQFAKEKEENHMRQLLVVQAAEQIIHRDNLIQALQEKNCQLEEKLQGVSGEQSLFGKIMEGFGAKCGVDVGRGVSAVQMLALLTDFVSNQFTTLDQFCVLMQGTIFPGPEVTAVTPPQLDKERSSKRGCSENHVEMSRNVMKSESANFSGVIPGLESSKPPVVKLELIDSEEEFNY